MHNDAGSINATADYWANAYASGGHDLNDGFTHYHVDKDKVVQCEDDSNQAWHCGDSYCNRMYLSLEVDQSMGASDEDFLKAEDRALKLVADKFKQYGIEPNENTVRLHKEVFATACPHRSTQLHGGDYECKQYFIRKIKAYMDGEEDIKGGTTMYATFDVKDGQFKGKIFFINLATEKIRYLGHSDTVNIYRKIFKANTGRDLPHYSFSTKDPFYNRIALGMTSEDVTVKMTKSL